MSACSAQAEGTYFFDESGDGVARVCRKFSLEYLEQQCEIRMRDRDGLYRVIKLCFLVIVF